MKLSDGRTDWTLQENGMKGKGNYSVLAPAELYEMGLSPKAAIVIFDWRFRIIGGLTFQNRGIA